jgi:predicted alpha-1,2-mannosidase
MRLHQAAALLFAAPLFVAAQSSTPATPYYAVDTNIGSAGEGMTSPTAQLPFGMVQWGPDTHVGEWYNYAYTDKQLLGFSLTHISGAGCRLYNDLPILPWLGEVGPGEIKDNPGVAQAYTLPWSHKDEQARPGYYAVETDNGIRVELTAGLRTAMGRFTFPSNSPRTLLLEAGSSSTADFKSAQGDISKIDLAGGNTAFGSLQSGHFCGGGAPYTLYFAMRFSESFHATGGWDTTMHPGATSASGHKAGAWVTFAPSAKPVLMQVALSFISVENAKANLNAELPARPEHTDFNADFDTLRHQAETTWSKALGTIETTGGTPDQRTIFYTSLYHALLSPNIFSDANGQYLDSEGKIRTLNPGEEQYTNFSDWDTYRAVIQLQSLLFPRQTSQMMQTYVRDAEQNGMYPRWKAFNKPLWVMSGDAPAILLSNAYAFGARDFDTHTALRYMVQAATTPATKWWNGGQERLHMEEYLSKGYISLDIGHNVYSAAASLDFNNADFAVSRMAAALGDQATAARLLKSAQNWRNLFDRDSRLIRPRESDGSFLANWDPDHMKPRYDRLSALGFEEGSAWQYTFEIPFNYAGLIHDLGGREAAIPKLDKYFEQVVGWNTIHFTTTNEPDFGQEYLYDWVGQPWKTQAVIARARDTFTIHPDGLPGNDDLGATSGLYIWDSIGIYPVIPGVGGFAIGTPLFTRSVVKLPHNRTLAIVAKGKGIYVDSLTLNGHAHPSTWLSLTELNVSHNQLVFTMSDQPNKTWGSGSDDAPPSFDSEPTKGKKP